MNKNLQSPESNPASKFYLTWHTCQYSKSLIDKALEIMNRPEFPNVELYPQAKELISDTSMILADIAQKM